jgi:death-on-curing protein
VCAATYAYHLTKAHAFLDGNKRIAAAAAELFLGLNDATLQVSNQELIAFFLDIAAGTIDRDQVEATCREWTILSDA